MHRWHHSTGKGKNRNFAAKLTLWNWQFKTSYLTSEERANTDGLRTYFPNNYFPQFLIAFLKI